MLDLPTTTLRQIPFDEEDIGDTTNTSTVKDRDFTLLLPDELLMQIFTAHQISWTRAHPARSILTWLVVTHICRRWRNVALASPIYWNVVPTHHLECTETMISRSQNMPVSIDFSNEPWNKVDTDPPGTEIALQQVYRASSIHVLLTPAMRKVMEHLMDAQMPLLTEFNVMFKRGQLDVSEIYDLPVSFLRADHAPLLSVVRLSQCRLSLDTPMPPSNITRLEFANIYLLRRPTIVQYCDILSGMPQLEVLIVGHAGPLIGDLASDRKVSLPCLRHLSLVDGIRSCVVLGRHLDLPPSTSLRLHAIQDVAPGSDVLDVAAALERDFVNVIDQHCAGRRDGGVAASEELTTLHIDDTPYMSLSVRLGGDDMQAEDPQIPMTSPAYDVAILWPRVTEYPRAAATALMSRLCDSLPTAHVRTVSVKGPFTISARRWNVSFGAMERVTAVSLDRDPAYGFIEAFSKGDLQNSDPYNSSRLFPALDRLQIIYAEFPRADGQSAIYKALKDGLRRRRELRGGKKMGLHIAEDVLRGSLADELAVDANVNRLSKSDGSLPVLYIAHDPVVSAQEYHDDDLDGM